jgi:hypothetical protein
MDVAKSASEVPKRKKVLWDYVLEPVNKATYWDHAALGTEERRVQAKRSFLVVGCTEQGRRPLKVDKDDGDELVRNEKFCTKSKLSTEAASRREGSKGVRCAERGGSAMMLWQHEFYYVLEIEETTGRGKAPPKPYLYQALQFSIGRDLPDDEKKGMSRKQLGEMYVQGVAYAPARNIRMYSTREKGYLFHTDWNDSDARTGLFWRCPEVVRVDNSTAWRAMSKVLTSVPRVVHPDDVYSGAVHVAGRDLHYVCGMCAHENVDTKAKELAEGPWGFVCKKIIREEDGVQVNDGFCMYPEERFGFNLNSATMMWEMVEFVFEGVRRVMRDNGRARSGSFSMVWSVVLQQFWEVSLKLDVVSSLCFECVPLCFITTEYYTCGFCYNYSEK